MRSAQGCGVQRGEEGQPRCRQVRAPREHQVFITPIPTKQLQEKTHRRTGRTNRVTRMDWGSPLSCGGCGGSVGSRRATALPRDGEAARVPPAPGTAWGAPGPLYLRATCGHPALAGLPSPLNAPTLCSWADSPLQLEPLTRPGFPQVSTPPSPGGGPQRRGWPPPSPPTGSGWCWLRSIGPLFTWPFTLSLSARGTQHALVAQGCRPAGSLLFMPPIPHLPGVTKKLIAAHPEAAEHLVQMGAQRRWTGAAGSHPEPAFCLLPD